LRWFEGQEIDDSGEFADGGISLIGDANGRIAFTVVGQSAGFSAESESSEHNYGCGTGEVQLRFKDANGNPIALPDDRYTLTIQRYRDRRSGRQQIGRRERCCPNRSTIPNFPSGNGIPGGNFHGPLTVDSRPELGDFAAAQSLH